MVCYSEVSDLKSILDIKFTDSMYMLLFNLLIFSSSIGNLFGISFIDEFATISVVLAAFVKLSGDILRKELRVSTFGVVGFFSMASLVIIGILGDAIWSIQTGVRPILIDLFTCVKFPLALISSLYLLNGRSCEMLAYITREVKVLVCLIAFLAFINLFVNFGMGGDYRHGIRSFVFLTGHQTNLTVLGVCLTLVLLSKPRENLVCIILSLFIISSGLRAKGLVFCALVPILCYIMRGGRKLNIIHILLCIVLALLIGWDQFASQFQTEGYARAELTRASFEIAYDYFPIGTGFATFGSNISGELGYYSPVYYMYDLAHVWGLAEGAASFLSDTFWPTILGQFGYLGLLTFIVMVSSLFLLTYTMSSSGRVASICGFAYLLISSTSESAFFHPNSVGIAFTIAIVICGLSARDANDAQIE